MHVETGSDLTARMSVIRGRMVGYLRGGNEKAYELARTQLTLLKAQRLQEVVVDLLYQAREGSEGSEGSEVSLDELLSRATQALDVITREVNRGAR